MKSRGNKWKNNPNEPMFTVEDGKGKVKVKIKDLWAPTFGSTIPNFKTWFYGWRILEKSIKTHGYKPEKFGYITVGSYGKNNYKYEVKNGNHRVKLLEKLYGKDFELEVNFEPKMVKNNAKSLLKKYFLLNQNMIHNVINIIGALVLIGYFFIFNFLSTIIAATLIWFIIQYFPEATYKKTTFYTPPEDKKKWFDKYPRIYTMLLNLTNNMRIILTSLVMLGYVSYLMYSNFILFSITMLILLIIGVGSFRKLM